jgi:hypothetical protein
MSLRGRQILTRKDLEMPWWKNHKGFIQLANHRQGSFLNPRLVSTMNGRTFVESRRKKVTAKLYKLTLCLDFFDQSFLTRIKTVSAQWGSNRESPLNYMKPLASVVVYSNASGQDKK